MLILYEDVPSAVECQRRTDSAGERAALDLLGGTKAQRLGFRALAMLLAHPERTVLCVADTLGAGRQELYRGLGEARLAGYDTAAVKRPQGRKCPCARCDAKRAERAKP